MKRHTPKVKLFYTLILSGLLVACGRGVSDGGSSSAAVHLSASEKPTTKMPDYIAQGKTGVGDVEIKVLNPNNKLKVGSTEDGQVLKIKDITIKGAKLDKDDLTSDLCISSDNSYNEFQGSCTIPILFDDTQQLGEKDIHIKFTLENGQSIDYTKKITVVDKYSPKLLQAPLLNSLEPLDSNIYFHNSKKLSIYNPLPYALNNVQLIFEGQDPHKIRTIGPGETETFDVNSNIGDQTKKISSFDDYKKGILSSSNIGEQLDINFLTEDQLIANIENLYIQDINTANTIKLKVYRPNVRFVSATLKDSDGSELTNESEISLNTNALESVSGYLQVGSVYEFKIDNVTQSAHGRKKLEVTLALTDETKVENKKNITLISHIEIAPIQLDVSSENVILNNASRSNTNTTSKDEIYKIEITNSSQFDWSVSDSYLELSGLILASRDDYEIFDTNTSATCINDNYDNNVTFKVLKSGETCQLYLKLDSLSGVTINAFPQFTIKKGISNLAADQSFEIKASKAIHNAFVSKPKRLDEKYYLLDVFNNTQESRLVLDLENIKPVVAESSNIRSLQNKNINLCQQLSNNGSQYSTSLNNNASCAIILEKEDVLKDSKISYAMISEANGENATEKSDIINADNILTQGDYHLLTSEDIYFIDSKHIIKHINNSTSQSGSLRSAVTSDLSQENSEISEVTAIASDYKGDFYIASNIKSLIHKLEPDDINTATPFIYLPSNDYIEDMLIKDRELFVLSFNPVSNENSFYKINLDTKKLVQIKRFNGSVDRMRLIQNDIHLLGSNLSFGGINPTTNILIYDTNIDDSELIYGFIPFLESLDERVLFDAALIGSNYYLATFMKGVNGLYTTEYPFQENAMAKKIPFNDSNFSTRNAYVSRLENSQDGALYGTSRGNNNYLLARLKASDNGQVLEARETPYIRSFVGAKDAVYFSYSQREANPKNTINNHDQVENYYISRWLDNNESIDSENALKTETLVNKLGIQNKEQVSDNSFFVSIPQKINVTEDQNFSIAAKVYGNEENISYSWSSNLPNVKSHINSSSTFSGQAPYFNPNESNEYKISLKASSSGATQMVRTSIFIEMDDNLIPTAVIADIASQQERAANVQLDGSGSRLGKDQTARNLSLTYDWRIQHGGGQAISLDKYDADKPKIVSIPYFTGDATKDQVTVTLKVTDGAGRQSEVSKEFEITADSQLIPIANAGGDQSVQEGTEHTVTGSGSAKGDRKITSYQWTGTGASHLSVTDKETPVFTAPPYKGNNDDTYYLTLTVTDSAGVKSEESTATYTITADSQLIPIANAGGDQSVQEGTEHTVTGSGSAKGDRKITSYQWTGTGASHLSVTDKETPVFTAPPYKGNDDTYYLTLTVTDSAGVKSEESTATYTITADSQLIPIANAGGDQSVQEGTEHTVTGSGSAKGDRKITSYQWTGTGASHLSVTDKETPVFTAPPYKGNNDDTYYLTLTVTDSAGVKSEESTATYTITADSQLIPIANAGGDQSVQEGTAHTVTGSGQAQGNREIASYKWEGTGASHLSNTAIATPVFTAPPYKGNDDTYYLTLTVTDSAGVKSEESTATYTITEDNTLKTKPLHIGPAQTGYGFSWPDQRFELANNADNSKCNDANYDKLTGLMWAKNGSASVSMQWADAKTYAADLSLCGYNDWRLPTVNELASLVNYQDTSSPAKWLNDNGFSNIKSSYYWSGMIYSLSGGYAWLVFMNNGGVFNYLQASNAYVLPVRGPN